MNKEVNNNAHNERPVNNGKKIWLMPLLLLLWISIMFSFSNIPGLLTLPFLMKLNILPEIKNPQLAKELEYVLRKSAHIMEYAVLFIIVFLTIKAFVAKESTARGLAKSMLFSLLFCFLFAISDEFHQTLVPNRTGKLFDVIIDLFGVFWGQVIILLYVIWRRQGS